MTVIPNTELLAADIRSLGEDIGFYVGHDKQMALRKITALEAKLARLRRELQRGEA